MGGDNKAVMGALAALALATAWGVVMVVLTIPLHSQPSVSIDSNLGNTRYTLPRYLATTSRIGILPLGILTRRPCPSSFRALPRLTLLTFVNLLHTVTFGFYAARSIWIRLGMDRNTLFTYSLQSCVSYYEIVLRLCSVFLSVKALFALIRQECERNSLQPHKPSSSTQPSHDENLYKALQSIYVRLYERQAHSYVSLSLSGGLGSDFVGSLI